MGDKDLQGFEVNDNSFMDAVEDSVVAAQDAKDENEDTTETKETADDSRQGKKTEAPDEEEVTTEDDGGDSDEGDDDEEDLEDEEDELDDEEKDPEATKDRVEKPKRYTATLEDGSQVKLDDNTTLKLKVNDRFERVSVAKLKEHYAGQVAYDEKIRRSTESEKQAKERLEDIENKGRELAEANQNIVNAITSGNILEAMSISASLNGSDRNVLLDNMVKGMTSFMEDFASKTPQEREAAAKRYRLESENKSLEAKNRALKEKDETRAQTEQIQTLTDSYGITREEYDSARDAYDNTNKQLEAAGKQKVKYTPEQVVRLALEYIPFNGLRDAAEELDIELAEKDFKILMKKAEALSLEKETRLEAEDYVLLLRDLHRSEVKNLSRKVGKTDKTSPQEKNRKR